MKLKTQETSRWDRNCCTDSIFADSTTQLYVSEGGNGYVHILGKMEFTVETGQNVFFHGKRENFNEETEHTKTHFMYCDFSKI